MEIEIRTTLHGAEGHNSITHTVDWTCKDCGDSFGTIYSFDVDPSGEIQNRREIPYGLEEFR